MYIIVRKEENNYYTPICEFSNKRKALKFIENKSKKDNRIYEIYSEKSYKVHFKKVIY